VDTLVANQTGAARREVRNGREYLVAPVTMIVSGVLDGSEGPIYYPPEEVEADPVVWNGIPLVVYHPTDNGRNVSARDPDVLEKYGVGQVFYAHAESGKLKAEAWFDVEATARVDDRVLYNLESGVKMELSTGLFMDREAAEDGAEYGGKPYAEIARNFRPDHLAVLPDQVGACSLADGCGVLVNSAGGDRAAPPPFEAVDNVVPDVMVNGCGCKSCTSSGVASPSRPCEGGDGGLLRADWPEGSSVDGRQPASSPGQSFSLNSPDTPRKRRKRKKPMVANSSGGRTPWWHDASGPGDGGELPTAVPVVTRPPAPVPVSASASASAAVVGNEQSLSERQYAVERAFRDAYPVKYDRDTGRPEVNRYVLAVFDDYLVYCEHGDDYYRYDYETEIYRLDYSADESGGVTFTGEPEQVRRETSYVAV